MALKTSQIVITATAIKVVGPVLKDTVVLVNSAGTTGVLLGANSSVSPANGYLMNADEVFTLNLMKDEELWACTTGSALTTSRLYVLEMARF